jgi:hypothetical protein
LTEHISGNLAKALRIIAVTGPSEGAGFIEFEDSYGNILRYGINASNYVEFGPPGSPSELAGPVSQLQFICYSLDDFSTPTTDVNSIRLVNVETTVANLSPMGLDKTFNTSVYIQTNADLGDDEGPGEAYLLSVSDKLYLSDPEAVFDSYRSSAGPYGPGNQSSEVVATTNSTLSNKVEMRSEAIIKGDVLIGPGGSVNRVIKVVTGAQITGSQGNLDNIVNIANISAPTGPPFDVGHEGDFQLSGDMIEIINSDRYFNTLMLWSRSVLRIEGDVTILVDDRFEVSTEAEIEIMPDSHLDLYVKNRCDIDGKLNANTADPQKLNFYLIGTDEWVYLDGASAQIFGAVQTPESSMYIMNSGQLFGSFMGSMLYSYNGGLHVDLSLAGGDGQIRP